MGKKEVAEWKKLMKTNSLNLCLAYLQVVRLRCEPQQSPQEPYVWVLSTPHVSKRRGRNFMKK